MSDSESKRKFFSGRSVEQAVVAAASHYGIVSDELKYRELEKRHGFVRTRRKVVISVDPEDFRKPAGAPPPPRPAAAETARPERVEEPGAPEAPEEGARRRPAPRRERAAREPEAPAAAGGEAEREPSRPRRPRRERAPAERRERGAEDQRGRGEPARTPWWQARPVGEAAVPDEQMEEVEDFAPEDDEEQDSVGEPVEESPEGVTEQSSEEWGDEQPVEAPQPAPFRGGPDRGEREGRYRFVERSEGLRRREAPLPPAERGRPAGGGRGGRRDEERPRGRRQRGGRGDRGGRGGGRPERREAPPREPALPPAPRPAPRSERLPRAEGELAEAAQQALDLLFGFADVEAEADFFRNEDRLEVELWGPDDHLLLQDDGQLLLAIEHLLPRMLRGIYGDSMAVRVDCNDFHFDREERLRELAVRTADDVRRQGRPRTLNELDPAERRIVHMALADDPDVTTDSIGDGYWKRLKVLPKGTDA